VDPIVIAFSFAESILFGRVVAMECVHVRRAWRFRNQPAPVLITPDSKLSENALAWWCIKIRH
jgi:hypothetical protein